MGRLTNIGPLIGGLAPKVKLAPKIADTFYQSKAWRGLASRIKRERGRRCARCGSTYRVIADHIVERRDGGAELDPSNIELLCFTHHQRKTADARKRRARTAT